MKDPHDQLPEDAFELPRTEASLGGMVEKFQAGDWESCIVKAGRFVEAELKALLIHAGQTLPPVRKFSAGGAIDDTGRLPAGTADDAVRLAIPRAYRFAYDVASNRGAWHDAGDVDPNEMDANAIAPQPLAGGVA